MTDDNAYAVDAVEVAVVTRLVAAAKSVFSFLRLLIIMVVLLQLLLMLLVAYTACLRDV